jgi:hypothetical protein
MPRTVFLSYARANLALAEELEREITTRGLTVWRDQEEIRVGARWPKALGEAIAKADAFLLLWSADSAKSDFLELEWTTALALKKAILPCLMDQTPLPLSLVAYNGISVASGVPNAANQICVALASESPSVAGSPENTKRVIDQLADIRATTPADVLSQFRTVIQGSVYQAGGNIYIGANPQPKTMLEKWQAWVAILAGIFTVLGIALAFWHNYAPVEAPKAASVQEQQQQSFAGSISDSANEPLPGVKVYLLLNEKLLASGLTDNLGRYTFHVTAAPEAEIMLLAQKEGFHTEKRYTQLGNTNFNFTMNRVSH